MRKIEVDSILGNEVLAKDLFSANGKFIMPAGTVLKYEHIKVLQSFNVTNVLVENERLVFEEGFMEKMQVECCKRVCEIIERYSHCGNSELSEIIGIADEIVTEALQKPEIMYNVCYIWKKNYDTYAHSINVCAMSVMVALRMKLAKNRIRDLAIGALLHDIGYVYLPTKFSEKKYENASPRERRSLCNHVINGYSSVEDESWISNISKEIILFHHERCDGSGFPFHYGSVRLKPEVKIVAVCNEFDSCLFGYHREKMKVHDIIEYILSVAGKKFDFEVVKVFTATVSVYPVGTYVCTDTGKIAVVVKHNAKMPLRPVIRMKYHENGKPYEEEIVVDLIDALSVKIIDTVDNLS